MLPRELTMAAKVCGEDLLYFPKAFEKRWSRKTATEVKDTLQIKGEQCQNSRQKKKISK